LQAPATNIADSRRAGPTAGGCQHLPEIFHGLQQPITGRDGDPFDQGA
jgi:hypothetical protein